MRKPHRYYRLAIRLYPQPYRREYGEQMVQTLSDMLADQPDRKSRTMVWLRVVSELPFSVMQENLSTLGGATMKKLSHMSNKRLAIAAILTVLVVVGVVFRGIVHGRLLADVVGPFYRHGVTHTLSKQQQALADPYIKLSGSLPPMQYNCSSLATQGIKTEVECQAVVSRYTLLPAADKKQAVLSNVSAIEAALKQQGYKSGNDTNGVTLTSLVAGTYEGKDYSPDAFYGKVTGSYYCVFDTTIAYSNPKPPAINMQMWCDRTIDVFGKPSTETYSSSRGFEMR